MTTHGMAQMEEYRIWAAMKSRCLNKTAKDYARYGGRGIQFCERWLNFADFIADVGRRPSSEHSIERVDNNGNYEPANVVWATTLEQANNKRSNHLVEYRGKQMSIANAARAAGAGVPRETATCRIKNGWTIERAVETPHFSNSGVTAMTEELKAAHERIDELKASLAEMVGVYWGDGDGIDPPPACIIRAQAALAEEILS